jgi:hypothetical protein
VEVSINPYTFETILKHRKEFSDDVFMQDILEHAEYQGIAYGYAACAYQAEYKSEKLDEANERLKESELMIVRMHKYILMMFGKSTVN